MVELTIKMKGIITVEVDEVDGELAIDAFLDWPERYISMDEILENSEITVQDITI